ncbi:lysoplasmalogenase [Olleya namhaensis]|uniref:lysoplasmalogenase n=1 Tax=Olleya namhaensis TaxID=1144750 RepID=UPI00232A8A1D|nr:lysoplasmalogenase [Olleya namhaensis]
MTKQLIYFSIIFFSLLFLDIYTKINLEVIPYRYITKILAVGSLVSFTIFYFYKKKELKNNLLIYGLFVFFIGDIIIIDHLNMVKFYVSLLLFVAGKICYTLKFMHKEDFSINRLIPFFIVCFLYVAIVYNFIFPNLKLYFIPITLYFFITLLMTLFAYIRKGVANRKSYYLVLCGVGFFIVSETIMVIKMFYGDVLFQDFLVMFCYGVAQYLIVLGLIFEDKSLTVKINSILQAP